jgi:hypothetical protein
MTELPADVVEAVRDVFAACNASSTATLTMAPNVQEEWLDHVWIGEVTRCAAPRVADSGWVVHLDTHYLGGVRHSEHFEIADIDVLVHSGSATRSARARWSCCSPSGCTPTPARCARRR